MASSERIQITAFQQVCLLNRVTIQREVPNAKNNHLRHAVP